MSNEVRVRVVAEDRASREFNAIAANAQRMSVTMKASLAGIGIAAAGGLGALGSSSVKAARSFNESMNAVRVVFRDASKQIEDFGKTSATSVGLSQRAFNQLATPVGAMLKNTGFGLQETAEHTIKLTERAADMASVFD